MSITPNLSSNIRVSSNNIKIKHFEIICVDKLFQNTLKSSSDYRLLQTYLDTVD